MQFRKALWSSLLVLGLLLGFVAYAQIRSSTITGAVKDATGAVVAGADVVITNQETNVSNSTKTTAAGQFTFPYLQAGVYTVAVNAPGFAPYRETAITLTTAQTVRVDVNLKVGTLEAAIEVVAAAAQIQTDSSTVQGAVQAEQIALIPNAIQNPLLYALLQPGVVPRGAMADTQSINSFGIGVEGRRRWSLLGVNGGRAWTNDIQLDGLPVMGGGYNEASVLPNTEGLQEVRVIVNNFSAQYGHGQAIVAMSTKSGTNQYHGQVDYRLRNEGLNANSNYNNAFGIARTAFKVHDLGGGVGGPVLKDKLFFFSSYHFLRHNRGSTTLMTVPTALERKGDFSKSFINVSGVGVPPAIFDPFNVTQLGADLFRRAPIPNAVIPNPDKYALLMYTYYPDPNRTPDDVFNTNDFSATTIQTVRRHSLNNRVDYRRGAHSIYGSGGLAYAKIVTPRPFGKAPFNDVAAQVSDKNPYGQIGDIIVINPSLVVDVRYGFNRIQTKSFNGNKEGFTDYDAFGIPKNLQALMLYAGTAPVVRPNDLTGGSGGGSNWINLSDGRFGHKREQQGNHNITGSVTKTHGRWTHKVGAEYRNLLSNYSDPEQAAAQIASSWHQVGGNFNFEYLTANGGVAGQNATNAQRGMNGAALLLGAGLWWIRPGANVTPAFSQKYFAVYSQNDWRATSKLTVNLGLRWDLQPGPTERFNRMSALDLTVKNAFGYQGALAFAGVGGYSRNLWDTVYNNWGPRFGVAYQLDSNTVVRGGLGITYLPSNTGYFSGPTDYGSSMFSSGTNQIPYGLTPQGVPVGRFSDPTPLYIAPGGNPSAPQVYGGGENRFDRFYKNGRVAQWNFFIERRFAGSWFASAGYSATHSTNLMNRSVPIQNVMSLPQATQDGWRAQYIASNGTLNPATQQVANPFQPASGTLTPFSGTLGNRTIDRLTTLLPYPLLIGSAAGISRSIATADYNSLQLHLSHAFTSGFLLNAQYVWSKELDNTDTMEDNQGFNSTGGGTGALDIVNWNNNRKVGFSDIPHRFVASFLYELPFGAGKAVEIENRIVRAIVGKWQTGGSVTLQQGMPFAIQGANTNGVTGRPDLVAGAALEVPKELQRWYDGNTIVTLPSGRQIKPARNTFLRYSSDAFRGRVLTMANGSVVPDVYWTGTAASTYDALRAPGLFNIGLSLRRIFPIREGIDLELAAHAMNLLNHPQYAGNYNGNLGSTNTARNATTGLVPGMGSAGDAFGTLSLAATDAGRQVILNLRLRF